MSTNISERKRQIKQAIRDAQRTGDTDYVKELREELQQLEEQEAGKLKAASALDAIAKSNLIQDALSKRIGGIDMTLDAEDADDFVQITFSQPVPMTVILFALAANMAPKQQTRQRIKHGKTIIIVLRLLRIDATLYLSLDDYGRVSTIGVV